MYLLDTHTLLWYFLGSDELGKSSSEAIKTQNAFYSVASLWEIAIKQSIGKLCITMSISELEAIFVSYGFLRLDISSFQLNQIKNLDDIHKDPFDRLLIAQALSKDLTIITSDEMTQKYSVKTLNARE